MLESLLALKIILVTSKVISKAVVQSNARASIKLPFKLLLGLLLKLPLELLLKLANFQLFFLQATTKVIAKATASTATTVAGLAYSVDARANALSSVWACAVLFWRVIIQRNELF